MKISQVNNSQAYNNQNSPSFSSFRMGREEADLIKDLVGKHVEIPSICWEYGIGTAFTEHDNNFMARLDTDEHKSAFTKWLIDTAPMVTLQQLRKMSKEQIVGLVSTTNIKFNEFAKAYNKKLGNAIGAMRIALIEVTNTEVK